MGVRMIVGDVRRVLDDIPDHSVDLVFTSPPFFNLRSYLHPDDPNKGSEIGAEATPAGYLETMLGLTEKLGDKLTEFGSLCVELGDSMAGSGGAGGDYNSGGLREGQQRFDGTAKKARREGGDAGRMRATRVAASKARGKPDGGSWPNRQVDTELGIRPREIRWKGQRDGFPLDKSHIGIPTLYTWSLAYGRNLLAEPFTAMELLEWIDALCAQGWSAEQALAYAGGWVAEHQYDYRHARRFEPWRIRNLAVWIRPNPSVGREGDKFRRSTSYITMACRSRDRWFDLDAVRKPNPRWDEFSRSRAQLNRGAPGYHTEDDESNAMQNPLGAPPSDHFFLSPAQYRGSHYAVMPTALCDVPIEAMCPRRVCRTCSQPSRRLSDAQPSPYTDEPGVADRRRGERSGVAATGKRHGDTSRVAVTTTWTTCGCPGTDGLRMDGMHTGEGWRPGVVLDPFGGSGTTGVAAAARGRDAILVDLDERNVALTSERIGIWLDSVEMLGAVNG